MKLLTATFSKLACNLHHFVQIVVYSSAWTWRQIFILQLLIRAINVVLFFGKTSDRHHVRYTQTDTIRQFRWSIGIQ